MESNQESFKSLNSRILQEKTEQELPGESILYRSDMQKIQVKVKHNFILDYLFFPQKFKNDENTFKSFFKQLQCNLVITNYRILLEPSFPLQNPENVSFLSWFEKQPYFVRHFFEIPLAQISTINSQDGNTNSLKITVKDTRSFNLAFSGEQKKEQLFLIVDGIKKQLKSNCFKDNPNKETISQAFTFIMKKSSKSNSEVDGWNIGSDIVKELLRQGEDLTRQGMFCSVRNQDFKICKSYPSVFVIPSNISLDEIISCSKFRTKNRMPALTYFHKRNGCQIWRSAQPGTGITGSCEEDIKMLKEISKVGNKQQTLQILDCRPFLNAAANKMKGGGYESTSVYTNTEFTFCEIDNIHAVSKVFDNMFNIACHPTAFKNQDEYQELLLKSGYLQFMEIILKGVNLSLKAILQKKQNVLVHCSDGWDRTAQLSALTQILLDPFFRTIQGFLVLIDKDWIHFGHQFHLRFGQYDSNASESQRSPVFIQFLDCVRQFLIKFPNQFEFSEELLLFIAFELGNGKYGNFLGNCEQDRAVWQLRQETESMWTYVLNHKQKFLNPLFQENLLQEVKEISEIPNVDFHNLVEWSSYFYRWTAFADITSVSNVLSQGLSKSRIHMDTEAQQKNLIQMNKLDQSYDEEYWDWQTNYKTQVDEHFDFRLRERRFTEVQKQKGGIFSCIMCCGSRKGKDSLSRGREMKKVDHKKVQSSEN